MNSQQNYFIHGPITNFYAQNPNLPSDSSLVNSLLVNHKSESNPNLDLILSNPVLYEYIKNKVIKGNINKLTPELRRVAYQWRSRIYIKQRSEIEIWKDKLNKLKDQVQKIVGNVAALRQQIPVPLAQPRPELCFDQNLGTIEISPENSSSSSSESETDTADAHNYFSNYASNENSVSGSDVELLDNYTPQPNPFILPNGQELQRYQAPLRLQHTQPNNSPQGETAPNPPQAEKNPQQELRRSFRFHSPVNYVDSSSEDTKEDTTDRAYRH